MALLCSALAWQREEKQRLTLEFQSSMAHQQVERDKKRAPKEGACWPHARLCLPGHCATLQLTLHRGIPSPNAQTRTPWTTGRMTTTTFRTCRTLPTTPTRRTRASLTPTTVRRHALGCPGPSLPPARTTRTRTESLRAPQSCVLHGKARSHSAEWRHAMQRRRRHFVA